jgi:Lhr-like helicase
MWIHPTKQEMIIDILMNKYDMVEHESYIKFYNGQFDIVVKSNHSIIVVDKRSDQEIVYKDLKLAHESILTTLHHI